MMALSESPTEEGPSWWPRILAGIAILALAAGAWFAFDTIQVCEQQLPDTGAPVEVCRKLAVTDPPVVAFGVVLLALVGVFYNEVSGFGITLKRQVQVAQQTAEDAKAKAAQAQGEVDEVKAEWRALEQGLRQTRQ